MKNIQLYTSLLIILLLNSCTDFDNDVSKIETDAGDANFSSFVALGGSFTAGFQDGALYLSGQKNSFPAIIAEQMGIFNFSQPLMADDLGGINMVKIPNKLELKTTPQGLRPVASSAESTTTIANIYKSNSPFANLGIPGAHTAHLLAKGYGNPQGLMVLPITANPYFARAASLPNSSILEDAVAQAPTFFSLWAGATDIIDIARKGCTTPFLTEQAFEKYYNILIANLTKNGAKGVVANIPNILQMPFFNIVPNKALKLNASQAEQLTFFFKVIASISLKGMIDKGIDPLMATKISEQYKIVFKEGENHFLIEVEKTEENPLGIRQMKPEDIILMSVNQKAMQEEGYGSVKIDTEVKNILGKITKRIAPSSEEMNKVIAAVNPIRDEESINIQELAMLEEKIKSYNRIISTVASENKLAFVDINKLINKITTKGIIVNAVNYNSSFVTGGFYSLDGIHPNGRGYAIIANEFIQAINKQYHSNLNAVDINSYNGVTYP